METLLFVCCLRYSPQSKSEFVVGCGWQLFLEESKTKKNILFGVLFTKLSHDLLINRTIFYE